MMPTVDPQQLAKVQAVSKDISAKIVVNYKEYTVLLSMKSDVAEAKQLIPPLLEQFSNALATQLSSFFTIKGEMVEVGKGE